MKQAEKSVDVEELKKAYTEQLTEKEKEISDIKELLVGRIQAKDDNIIALRKSLHWALTLIKTRCQPTMIEYQNIRMAEIVLYGEEQK